MTLRISPKQERGRPAESDQTADAAPAVRRSPGPRLSWPSRDSGAHEPRNQQAPLADVIRDIPPRDDLRAPTQRDFDQVRPDSDTAQTQLYRPNRATQADHRGHQREPGADIAASTPFGPAAQRTTADPVVGWLVIVEGPGKGRSLELGMGANPIGRNATQKIALDFGDHEIHREKHAILVFDPRSKRFFLQGSVDARNLTYLGDDLVLMPTELKGGETIIVGRTELRFIPLCGPDFSWSQ